MLDDFIIGPQSDEFIPDWYDEEVEYFDFGRKLMYNISTESEE